MTFPTSRILGAADLLKQLEESRGQGPYVREAAFLPASSFKQPTTLGVSLNLSDV